MAGFGPKLPLRKDQREGFALTSTLRENVKQSFKMLLLTNPGERMMLHNYGVGLRTYLFEPYGESTESEIAASIEEQLDLYLPYLKIESLSFPKDKNLLGDDNTLQMRIKYSVPVLGVSDQLDLSLEGYNF